MNNQDISEDNPVQDVVGSAVVSFTIAGLLPGTILPEPLLIDLRIADPVTGSSEVASYQYSVLITLMYGLFATHDVILASSNKNVNIPSC